MKILVTGGAGYIGSTVCSALNDAGHVPIVLDSLITGQQEFGEKNVFYRGDVSDLNVLQRIVKEQGALDGVIHLAALIQVPESVVRTYEYYRENVGKTIEFLNNLNLVGCKNVIFSSSASVYGNTDTIEVTENSKLNPGSPYARTKAMIEEILSDYCDAYDMKAIALRYFNPIGADPKMRTGSFIKNPSHILGILLKTYRTDAKEFTITGVDWPTRDGSGIRDYIHIWDLAQVHVRAIEKMDEVFSSKSDSRFIAINVGRGEGITVRELVSIFEDTVGVKLNVKEGPPRDGDVAGAYANCDLAEKLLDWKAGKSIAEAIQDAIKWEGVKHSLLKK